MRTAKHTISTPYLLYIYITRCIQNSQYGIILTLVSLIISPQILHAQKKHHLRISTGGGKHFFSYPLEQIDSKKNSGLAFTAEYDTYFKRQWAFSYGIGFQNYTAHSEINGEYDFDALDFEGNYYKYKLFCHELNTLQESLMVNFPVGVRYETKHRAFRTIYDKYLRLSFTLGFSYALPIDSKHTHSGGTISTSGYYPQFNGKIVNVPDYWFDTFNAAENGQLVLKDSYLVTSEIGILLDTEKRQEFYLGIYFNYGVNNSIKSSTTPVVNSNGTQTSLLYSDLTQKAHLISYGIKLGVSISLKKRTQYLEANNL